MRIRRGAALALVLTCLAAGCNRGAGPAAPGEVPKVQDVKAKKLQMPDVGKHK